MYPDRARTAKESRLQRNWRPFFIAVNTTVDSVVVVITAAAAYFIRKLFFDVPDLSPEPVVTFTVFAGGVFVFCALITGLYRDAYRTPRGQQRRDAARTYTYSACTILVTMYLVLGGRHLPRYTILFLGLLPIVYILGRHFLRRWARLMGKRGYGRHNTLVINMSGSEGQVLERLAILPDLGYSVRGIICAGKNGKKCEPGECRMQDEFTRMRTAYQRQVVEPLPCFGMRELESALQELAIERVIVPQVSSSRNGFGELLRQCREQRIKLKVVSRESEQLLRFSSVKDIAGIPLYSPPRDVTEKSKSILKRAFDLTVSIPLLIVLSPLLALVSIAVLIEDGRPVFFTQKRALSSRGRRFDLLKFRSMARDAERKQRALRPMNETEQGLFLLHDDPRVTRVGQLIRKYSIDELPQLINVVRGEMSLVGPRPLALNDLRDIEGDAHYASYYKMREKVRPGMTGLWQISGRREVPAREMVFLDLYYIENHTIPFDLEILFATIPVILFGRGAY